ncbi:MAG: ScyD/ScyE family protein [Acidimicrobiia bacterium]|nr:ScyD/ScyE family protein [Acidimicrobiia bacterium]
MHRRVRIRHLVAGLVALAGMMITTGAAPAGAAGPRVLLDNLSSPKGLTLDGQGNPVISQGAFGPPGQTLRYNVSGSQAGSVDVLGGAQATVGIAWAKSSDSYWTLGPYYRALYRAHVKATPSATGMLARFAIDNPDPYDQDNFPTESNPFAIAAEPNGNALVGDAAANSVVRIDKQGHTSLVARLALQTVNTPPGSGLPPQMTAEAVATSVAVAADGTIYVGELKGFPFVPGTSNIWKIPAGTTNAVCSANPAVPAKKCSLYKSGLTSIAALAVAPDQSAVYALEYAKDGVGAFEACLDGSTPCPPAVLVKIKGGHTTELAAGQLREPGSLATDGHSLYVTDHVFTGGRLLRLPA